MKAKPGILDALQNVLSKELTGINQYFIHSKMCANWGYDLLAKFQWDESMDEMRHADKLIDRMLFLDGAPNMTRYDKIVPGQDAKSMIATDLGLELSAITTLQESIAVTFEQNDHVTRELFETILGDEESHVDWLEAQLEQIGTMGIENWLVTQKSAKPQQA
jgi:bacterioferritin